MAFGSWEDFTSKYGFCDGNALEERDLIARDLLVDFINEHPAVTAAKVTAVPYDRPGAHNPCLIIVLPNPDAKPGNVLRGEWLSGKIEEVPLPEFNPDEAATSLSALIEQAYARASNKGRR